jgi:hypothetical protein
VNQTEAFCVGHVLVQREPRNVPDTWIQKEHGRIIDVSAFMSFFHESSPGIAGRGTVSSSSSSRL